MAVLDAQVHTWYSDRPSRPWDPNYRPAHMEKLTYLQHAGQTNCPDMVRRELLEVGVDCAILTPNGVYGKNIDLELETAENDPNKFKVIGLVNHLDPKLREHLEESKHRGLVGIRMLEMREPDRVARGEFNDALHASADLDLVVALSLSHPLNPQLLQLFHRHKDVFFLIDHLGTGYAPPILGYRPHRPFEHLETVAALAELPNVGLKLTGAPSLSKEPFPFKDIWNPVKRLIAAFGPERTYWGSDYTRTAPLFSYWESKHYLAEIPGLGNEELSLLYGGALAELLQWNIRP